MLRPPLPAPRDLLPTAAGFAVALAALAAMVSFGAGLVAPGAAAETAYLATVAGALLVCLAAAGGGDSLLAATAVLAVAAAWVPPPGPARGAT
ncbi:MAG TPA: hypothetical protein VHQ65_14080, partial [Thermoanaerobaculia bacterium]|nr:hypothetical protein [Thermoanaerobaculia bacterium]